MRGYSEEKCSIVVKLSNKSKIRRPLWFWRLLTKIDEFYFTAKVRWVITSFSGCLLFWTTEISGSAWHDHDWPEEDGYFRGSRYRGSYLRDCVKRSELYLHDVDFLRGHVKKLISPWKVNYLKLRGDENTLWQKISVHFTCYLVNDFVANVTLKIWKIMDITEDAVVLLSSRCCSKNLSEYIALKEVI